MMGPPSLAAPPLLKLPTFSPTFKGSMRTCKLFGSEGKDEDTHGTPCDVVRSLGLGRAQEIQPVELEIACITACVAGGVW